MSISLEVKGRRATNQDIKEERGKAEEILGGEVHLTGINLHLIESPKPQRKGKPNLATADRTILTFSEDETEELPLAA